jgi:uncharacterized protein YqhQ
MSMTTKDDVIAEIAKRHLLIDTLETRNNDSEDFYEVAIWCIKAALQEAYEAGQNASAINADSE